MSNKCEISGKKPQTGNSVSFSGKKTKRKFKPNLVKVTVIDEDGNPKRMEVSTRALKTLEKYNMDLRKAKDANIK